MSLKYDLISINDHTEFMDRVSDAMNRGWKLQGGVDVIRNPDGSTQYTQALYAEVKDVP